MMFIIVASFNTLTLWHGLILPILFFDWLAWTALIYCTISASRRAVLDYIKSEQRRLVCLTVTWARSDLTHLATRRGVCAEKQFPRINYVADGNHQAADPPNSFAPRLSSLSLAESTSY